jgi:hypothetical protein
MKSASVPAVATLRSTLSMYVFFVYGNSFFLLLVLLTAHRRLLSEESSYGAAYGMAQHLKTVTKDYGCTVVIPGRHHSHTKLRYKSWKV